METNGNVNYDGIHRQWHSSRWNYRFVCFQFLIRDISIRFVSEVTILMLIKLMLNYAPHNEPVFSGDGVCGVKHTHTHTHTHTRVCVCVSQLCQQVSTVARLIAVTPKVYRQMDFQNHFIILSTIKV
jgi:hypothetical protein